MSVSGTTTTTSFTFDGLALMKLSATQGATTWRIDYLYDEDGMPYGGVYRSPSPSTSPTYFTMITTDRSDIVELCDADGNAFAAYRYDPWGSPTGSGNYATGIWTQSTSLVTSALVGQIASRQVLRYAGYAYDSESGLYYCSARYYDPATRQWTSGDPAKADGEESAYQYCNGDPINGSDPTGQFFILNSLKKAVQRAWRYTWVFVPYQIYDSVRYTYWWWEVQTTWVRKSQAEVDADINRAWRNTPAEKRKLQISNIKCDPYEDGIDLSTVTMGEKREWASQYATQVELSKFKRVTNRVLHHYPHNTVKLVWKWHWVLRFI